MSLTRRVYGGKKSRNSKKGRGHCRIGGNKTLKKGVKSIFVPARILTNHGGLEGEYAFAQFPFMQLGADYEKAIYTMGG